MDEVGRRWSWMRIDVSDAGAAERRGKTLRGPEMDGDGQWTVWSGLVWSDWSWGSSQV